MIAADQQTVNVEEFYQISMPQFNYSVLEQLQMGSSVEENISIKDALINVSVCFTLFQADQNINDNAQVLDDLTGLDNQPCIEGFSLTLDSRADFDTNFEDCKAFVTSCSKYIEEATRHAEFVSFS